MKVYRESVTYDLYDVDGYSPVHDAVRDTYTMRPYYGMSYRGKETSTLYKLGNNLYVMHNGRWYRCERWCGAGEYFILLDKYRRLT